MLTLPRRDDELVGVQLGALHHRHRVDEDGAEDRLQRARAVEALERVVEGARQGAREAVGVALDGLARLRSEEHTSELQSLMRISYAVFCLKKKTNKRITSIS